MIQENYRSSADDESNNDHPHTRAEGKSGGNAGAGQSGKEGLGTEKKTDDERFGSRKAGEAQGTEGQRKEAAKNKEYWEDHQLNRPN
jgi:hypothetical protein